MFFSKIKRDLLTHRNFRPIIMLFIEQSHFLRCNVAQCFEVSGWKLSKRMLPANEPFRKIEQAPRVVDAVQLKLGFHRINLAPHPLLNEKGLRQHCEKYVGGFDEIIFVNFECVDGVSLIFNFYNGSEL